MVLVGTKCDLEDKREVSRDEGERLAREWRCSFFEASAKIPHNVDEVFMDITRQILLSKDPSLGECNIILL